MKKTEFNFSLNVNQTASLCIGGIGGNVCHTCPPIDCDLLVGEATLRQSSIVLHAHRFALGLCHFYFFLLSNSLV
jgi:hypothetical protein